MVANKLKKKYPIIINNNTHFSKANADSKIYIFSNEFPNNRRLFTRPVNKYRIKIPELDIHYLIKIFSIIPFQFNLIDLYNY